jgi:hypothetical protein
MLSLVRRPGHVLDIHTEAWSFQVAPTILSILGLDYKELEAVGIEGTELLPGFRKPAAGMSAY